MNLDSSQNTREVVGVWCVTGWEVFDSDPIPCYHTNITTNINFSQLKKKMSM
jgi:hypothetical protein